MRYCLERRHFFDGIKQAAIAIHGLAILLMALAVGPAVAAGAPRGAAGSLGNASRELGEIDLLHSMFDFGGASGLSDPEGVAIDASGHLYVADSINNRVLGWSSASAFADGAPASLVIGQPDFYSYRCDDGTAGGDANGIGADSLCGPEGIAVDGAGNLYVADTIDNRVLEYNQPFLSGLTHGQAAATVLGQHGGFTASACNDGTAAGDLGGIGPDSLCDPRAVVVDSVGNVYVADSGNSRVLEYNTPLNPASGESGAGDTITDKVFGQNGSFTTISCNDGKGAGDVGGVGPDSLCGPGGLALDASGNLFVADINANRVLE
jgi:sugar lactone lactonase YvrE